MSGRSPFDKLSGLEALTEIGRRLSGLGGQVKNALEEAQAKSVSGQQDDAHQNTEKRFTINTPAGPVEGISQVSFRVGSLSDRMPSAARGSSNGNASGAASRAERTAKPAPNVDGAREPLVDCFDEGETLVVTAELPGVLADHVTVSVEGNFLMIETGGQRRYRTRQILSAAVDPATLTYELRNGILEARIAKAAMATPSPEEANP